MPDIPKVLVCFDDLPRDVVRAVKREPEQLKKFRILIEHYKAAADTAEAPYQDETRLSSLEQLLVELTEPGSQVSGFASRALGFLSADGDVHLHHDGTVVSVPRHTAIPSEEWDERNAAANEVVISQLLDRATRHLEKNRPADFAVYQTSARHLMDGRHRTPALRDDLSAQELHEKETLANIQLIVAHQLYLDRQDEDETRFRNALLISEWLRRALQTQHTDGFHVPAGSPFFNLFKKKEKSTSRDIYSSPSTISATGSSSLRTAPHEWIEATHWRRVGGQLGSNPGGTYIDQYGQTFYVKLAPTPDHARNEVLAADLYMLAGVDVPELKLVMYNGRPGTASRIIANAQSDLEQRLRNDSNYRKTVQDGFAVDVWVANWDVAGTAFDNIVSSESGIPVRIDTGGALLFRANGEPKGSLLSPQANEWDSLRNERINRQSARLFADISSKRLKDSVRRIVSVRPEAIDVAVDALDFDAAASQGLKNILKSRRADLANRADIALPERESAGATADQSRISTTGYYGNPGFQSSAEDRSRFVRAFRSYERYQSAAQRLATTNHVLRDIPEEDLVAILGYTGNAFFDIVNKALREQNAEELRRYDAHIRGVVSGLNRLPVHVGTVTRAIEIYTRSDLKQVVARYKVGTIIEEKSFVSTDVAQIVRPGNIIFTIKSKTGRRIDMLSEYQDVETEVTFPPGVKFHVTKNTKKGDQHFISMEEVEPAHPLSDVTGPNAPTQMPTAQAPAWHHTSTVQPTVAPMSASQALGMLGTQVNTGAMPPAFTPQQAFASMPASQALGMLGTQVNTGAMPPATWSAQQPYTWNQAPQTSQPGMYSGYPYTNYRVQRAEVSIPKADALSQDALRRRLATLNEGTPEWERVAKVLATWTNGSTEPNQNVTSSVLARPPAMALQTPGRPLGIRERVTLAWRTWENMGPEGVKELEELLRSTEKGGPGSRSLVIGAALGEPEKALWAVNYEGVVRWRDNAGNDVQTLQDETERIISIDLNPRSDLIHVPAQLKIAGSEATNFCTLAPGMNLTRVM
ncbi:ADP-ribosyltransferase domain-containing protein (plasmid) [Streptomyces sp. HUAS TT11]|uniref:ADP-ribosyltransferase domain-containing protein n=1 Tax=Streptomyces sp. HUAS TT11 TaxID=3447508 RepID=UPI003F657291